MSRLPLKLALLVTAAITAFTVQAVSLEPGAPLPPLSGTSLGGNTFAAASESDDDGAAVQLLLFFRPDAGDELANKLRTLHEQYGKSVVRCAAIGVNTPPGVLRDFAERMGITYPSISSDDLTPDARWCIDLPALPVTVVASTGRSPLVLRVLTGSGTSKNALLTEVAEQLFQQRRAEAIRVAELALSAGEPEGRAREIRAYSLAETGNIEVAKREFEALDSPVGMAQLEIAEGNLDTATRLLQDSTAPEARALLAEISFMQGSDAEAAALLSGLDPTGLPALQSAQVAKLRGDLAHRRGDNESAQQHYEAAIRSNPANPALLVEAGIALSDLDKDGALREAESVLQRAASISDDPLAEGLLKRVAEARAKAADTAHATQVREQIAALKARYEEERSKGITQDSGTWTSPPLHFAVLNEGRKTFAFPRAGYDVLIQQEVEALVREKCAIPIIDRDVLHPLLVADANETSPELKPEQQPVLGRAAGLSHIAFLNYTLAASERRVHLRVLDVATTEILFHDSAPIDLKAPLSTLPSLLESLRDTIREQFPLRGIVSEVQPDGRVKLNVGRAEGLTDAEALTVYEPEPAVRSVAIPPLGQLRPIARLVVEAIGETESSCRVTKLREGHTIGAGAWVARDRSDATQ